MSIKDELIGVIGTENVSDDPGVLESYSKDYSLAPPRMPDFAIYPENTGQVRDIVRICNQYSLPIIPCSSRVHFRGCTIPKQGGVILDLKRMNKIISINERNRYVMIEPGVTWG